MQDESVPIRCLFHLAKNHEIKTTLFFLSLSAAFQSYISIGFSVLLFFLASAIYYLGFLFCFMTVKESAWD